MAGFLLQKGLEIMADRKNQFGQTEAGQQLGTVHLVVDASGQYRTTADLSTLQPGEANVARASCWRNSGSADDAAQVLLDRVNAGGSFS